MTAVVSELVMTEPEVTQPLKDQRRLILKQKVQKLTQTIKDTPQLIEDTFTALETLELPFESFAMVASPVRPSRLQRDLAYQVTSLHTEFCLNTERVAESIALLYRDAHSAWQTTSSSLNTVKQCQATSGTVASKAQELHQTRHKNKRHQTMTATLIEKLRVPESVLDVLLHNDSSQAPSSASNPSSLPTVGAQRLQCLLSQHASVSAAIETLFGLHLRAERLSSIIVEAFASFSRYSDPPRRNPGSEADARGGTPAPITAVATFSETQHPALDYTKRLSTLGVCDAALLADITTTLSRRCADEAKGEAEALLQLAYEKLFLLSGVLIKSVPNLASLLRPSTPSNLDTVQYKAIRDQIIQTFEILQNRPKFLQLLILDIAKKQRQHAFQLVDGFRGAFAPVPRVPEGPSHLQTTGHIAHVQPAAPAFALRAGQFSLTGSLAARLTQDFLALVYHHAVNERQLASTLVPAAARSQGLTTHQPLETTGDAPLSQVSSSTPRESAPTAESGSLQPCAEPSSNPVDCATRVSRDQEEYSCDLAFARRISASSPAFLDYVLSGVVPVMEGRLREIMDTFGDSPVDLCYMFEAITVYAQMFASLFSSSEADADHIPTSPSTTVFDASCKALRQEAYQRFITSWETKISRLVALPPEEVWTRDLTRPAFLQDHLTQLSEVLSVCETVSQVTSGDAAREMVDDVMNTATTPLLNFCCQAGQQLPPTPRTVYLINCYTHVESHLLLFPSAHVYAQVCSELIRDQKQRLIEAETASVLCNLGFSERLEALRVWQEKPPAIRDRQPLSSITVLHPLSLSVCFRSLTNAIFSTGELPLPHVQRIRVPSLRVEIQKTILYNVVDVYEQLYNGTNAESIAPYTPSQIREFIEVFFKSTD